jgi:hypothetical protein
MRKLMIAALVAGQVVAGAQPTFAAELRDERAGMPNQVSAFAGARVRVPLGGGREKARAGLALAPTLRGGATGELRFARGMEFGFAGERKMQLSIGGMPASRLVQGPEGPKGTKAGVSTLGWVAIGVGVAAVAVLSLYGLCASETICNFDDE